MNIVTRPLNKIMKSVWHALAHFPHVRGIMLSVFISTAGGDYTPLTTDLTFGATMPTKMVMIVIFDDLLVEGSEYFNVALTTTDLNVTLAPAAATVTIEDVDGKLLHIQR